MSGKNPLYDFCETEPPVLKAMLEISFMYFTFIIIVELPQLVSSLLSQTENEVFMSSENH